MREIRADWEKFGQIRRSPGAGGRCFLTIIRVYFIASAIFLRNCLVPSHAQEWSCGAVPPQSGWHEGVSSGLRAASGEDGTRGLVFLFGGCSGVGGEFFHTLGAGERHRFNGGAVAVCFEGCCGSMCWPGDRPATHAAAGAAARGVREIGGLFHTHWSGHAAPCHLRRDGTRGFNFLFWGFFHTLGSGQTRMPPRERLHEGFWFFVWGIVSHAQEWSCGAVPPQSDGTPPCGGAGED